MNENNGGMARLRRYSLSVICDNTLSVEIPTIFWDFTRSLARRVQVYSDTSLVIIVKQ